MRVSLAPSPSLQVLQRKGVCPDNIVPKKDPAFGQAVLSPEHYAAAEPFRIKHYARVYDIDELKLALVADGPVVASFKARGDLTQWVAFMFGGCPRV